MINFCPVIKIALQHYSPEQVATIRFLFASLFILLLSYKIKFRPPRLKTLPLFLAFSFIGLFGCQLLLNYGASLTNAGTAGFIINTAPIFSLLFSYFIFKEKITPLKVIGTLLSLFGVWLIVQSNGSQLSVNVSKGIGILLLSALAWSLFFILQKILLRNYSNTEITAYGIWTATLMFSILNNPLEILRESFHHPHLSSFLACAYLGIFSTSITYWLWAYTLKHMDVSTASIYTYCIPFISALLSSYLLRENYGYLFFLGGTLIIVGMLIANNLNFLKKLNNVAKQQILPATKLD